MVEEDKCCVEYAIKTRGDDDDEMPVVVVVDRRRRVEREKRGKGKRRGN